MAKKPMKPMKGGKSVDRAEKAIEKTENKLAKKLPAPARKQFAKVQAKEKKLEGRE
jgi:hypothetical protein